MTFNIRYKLELKRFVPVVESEEHLVPALLLVVESVHLEMMSRWPKNYY